jgi:hypothetical protein
MLDWGQSERERGKEGKEKGGRERRVISSVLLSKMKP